MIENAKKYLRDKNYTLDAIECHDRNLTNGKIDLPKIMEDYHQNQLMAKCNKRNI